MPDDVERRTTRFSRLPQPVPPEKWVEEQDAEPPHDPNGGRDPETDWMLRNTGG